ncbi:MAG: hypothetical protein IT373_15480 [Polyangiaceae bacterium]|nr:hypothetical protein [Polyangiaceae bacterium]
MVRRACGVLGVVLCAGVGACESGGDDGPGAGGSGATTTTTTTGTAGAGGTTTSSHGGAGGAGGATTSSGGGGAANTGGGGAAAGETVACDALQCAVPGTECCQHYNQPAECIVPGGTCTYGVPLACDGPEDCGPAEICCATVVTQGPANAYQFVSCAATCTGNDHRVVCGASGVCPGNLGCVTSDMLPPYLDCQ